MGSEERLRNVRHNIRQVDSARDVITGSEDRERKVRYSIRQVDSARAVITGSEETEIRQVVGARAVLKENGLPGRERTTNNVCNARRRPYSSYYKE